jgi:hypothetical protein
MRISTRRWIPFSRSNLKNASARFWVKPMV